MPGARDIADRLIASFGSMLLYWYHYSHERPPHRRRDRRRFDRRAFPAPAARQAAEARSWVRAMHTSLNLYAEHEFNASTFAARVVAGTGSDMHSAITGGIGALRGPKHGGANEVGFEVMNRYETPGRRRERHRDSACANKETVIGFGHPVYTIADPRNKIIKEVARTLSAGQPAT